VQPYLFCHVCHEPITNLLTCRGASADHDRDASTPCYPCPVGTEARGPPNATHIATGAANLPNAGSPDQTVYYCGTATCTGTTFNTECFPCPTGRFDKDSNPGTRCSCPLGTEDICSATGCQCTPCAGDSWDHDNSALTPCQLCGPGNTATTVSCQPCAAGRHDDDQTSSTPCVPCAPGTYSGGSYTSSAGHVVQAVCQPCGFVHGSIGTSDHDTDPSTQCITCPITSGQRRTAGAREHGLYHPISGQRLRYANGTGMSYQDANAVGGLPCTGVCGVGTYKSGLQCAECAPGLSAGPKWSTINGTQRHVSATTCTRCGAGQYNGAGRPCMDCASGMYDDDMNASTPCRSCPTGKYASFHSMFADGSTDTVWPTLGHAVVSTNSTYCVDCPAGLYDTRNASLLAADLPCAPCAPGTYSGAPPPRTVQIRAPTALPA
jgi:hypothetical protein